MPIKFKLEPNPTFKSTVAIPVHGAGAEPVEFTFKHRSRESFLEFANKAPDLSHPDLVMEVASGWELAEPFDREHIEKMDQTYMGAARAIWDRYVAEMTGNAHRLGN